MTEAGAEAGSGRRLVALDIDGTVVDETGAASPAVRAAITAAIEAGHEVMLATGRTPGQTLPVAALLGLRSEYQICSNGAIVLQRDPAATDGYSPVRVETFVPAELIDAVEARLTGHAFAVEDADGIIHHTEGFPSQAARGVPADLAALRELTATRLVVVSADDRVAPMLELAAERGLHRASYTIGRWSWLDIAPDGVNKGTALEWVRQRLGLPASALVAIGDGQNDIEMFELAGAEGVAAAMADADPAAAAAATERTGPVADGVARVLRRLLLEA